MVDCSSVRRVMFDRELRLSLASALKSSLVSSLILSTVIEGRTSITMSATTFFRSSAAAQAGENSTELMPLVPYAVVFTALAWRLPIFRVLIYPIKVSPSDCESSMTLMRGATAHCDHRARSWSSDCWRHRRQPLHWVFRRSAQGRTNKVATSQRRSGMRLLPRGDRTSRICSKLNYRQCFHLLCF